MNSINHSKVSFNSALVGIAGAAPNLEIVKKAALVANSMAFFSLSFKSLKLRRPTAKAPVNASPAPVVSTSSSFLNFSKL